jgi:KaiC/GvpD/RAD55 family RecA-like ATPase
MNEDNPAEGGEQRLATGIAGLDSVLCGGLDAERLYLVEGEPGTGKTTLALQFLLDGARRGEKASRLRFRKANESFVLWRSVMVFIRATVHF